jgi:hypothetical protein
MSEAVELLLVAWVALNVGFFLGAWWAALPKSFGANPHDAKADEPQRTHAGKYKPSGAAA